VRPERTDADQHTTARDQHERGGRVRHNEETERVGERSDHDDLPGAIAIGEHAGKRLHDTPHQVLHGDGKREGFTPPVQIALIGCRKRPKPWRSPIEIVRTIPPHTRTTVGVRQSARVGAGDIDISRAN
jgi:hypothetical protein